LTNGFNDFDADFERRSYFNRMRNVDTNHRTRIGDYWGNLTGSNKKKKKKKQTSSGSSVYSQQRDQHHPVTLRRSTKSFLDDFDDFGSPPKDGPLRGDEDWDGADEEWDGEDPNEYEDDEAWQDGHADGGEWDNAQEQWQEENGGGEFDENYGGEGGFDDDFATADASAYQSDHSRHTIDYDVTVEGLEYAKEEEKNSVRDLMSKHNKLGRKAKDHLSAHKRDHPGLPKTPTRKTSRSRIDVPSSSAEHHSRTSITASHSSSAERRTKMKSSRTKELIAGFQTTPESSVREGNSSRNIGRKAPVKSSRTKDLIASMQSTPENSSRTVGVDHHYVSKRRNGDSPPAALSAEEKRRLRSDDSGRNLLKKMASISSDGDWDDFAGGEPDRDPSRTPSAKPRSKYFHVGLDGYLFRRTPICIIKYMYFYVSFVIV
jgi:hypothetical protein